MNFSKVIIRTTSILLAFTLAITASMLPHLQHSVSADIDNTVVASVGAPEEIPDRSLPVENPAEQIKDSAASSNADASVKVPTTIATARLTEEQENAMVRLPVDRDAVVNGKANLPNLTKASRICRSFRPAIRSLP